MNDHQTGNVRKIAGVSRQELERRWKLVRHYLTERGIDTRIPFTVDDDGFYTKEAPGFEGKRVITDKGEKGDANEAVISALKDAGMLVARERIKHQYPHSWRSKKPIIFRNTPQWFISMSSHDVDGITSRDIDLDGSVVGSVATTAAVNNGVFTDAGIANTGTADATVTAIDGGDNSAGTFSVIYTARNADGTITPYGQGYTNN